MPSLTNSSPFLCAAAPLSVADVDLLILPWFDGEGLGAFEALNLATGGEIARALSSKEFAAHLFDLFVTPIADRSWKPKRVALVGAGPIGTFDIGLARRTATAAALAARQRRVERVGFVLRHGVPDASGDIDVAGFAQAITEGLTLAEFNGGSYRTMEPSPAQITACTILLPELPDTSPESSVRVTAAVERGRLLGECSNLARDMANEPGNTLTPMEFARRAGDIASGGGVEVEILDEKQI